MKLFVFYKRANVSLLVKADSSLFDIELLLHRAS